MATFDNNGNLIQEEESGLWSKIKSGFLWAATGVAGLFGLSLLVNSSPETKKFLNEFGGAGDMLADVFPNVKKGVSNLLGLEKDPLSRDDVLVSEKVKLITKENSIDVLVEKDIIKPKPVLKDSPVLKNPRLYADIDDIAKARAAFDHRGYDDDHRKNKNDELLEKRSHLMDFALAATSWDKEAIAYKKENAVLINEGKLPDPPLVGIVLPKKLSEILERHGKKMNPQTWDDADILKKMQLLESDIEGRLIKKPNLKNYILANRDFSKEDGVFGREGGWLAKAFVGAQVAIVNNTPDLGFVGYSNIDDSPKGKGLHNNSVLEVRTKREIEELLADGKMGEALALAKQGESYFSRASMPDEVGQDGTKYTYVSESFKEIVSFIESSRLYGASVSDANGEIILMQGEFAKASNLIYSNIRNSAEKFRSGSSTEFDKYEGSLSSIKTRNALQVEEFMKANPTAQPASAPAKETKPKEELKPNAPAQTSVDSSGAGRKDKDYAELKKLGEQNRDGSGVIYDNKLVDDEFKAIPRVVSQLKKDNVIQQS